MTTCTMENGKLADKWSWGRCEQNGAKQLPCAPAPTTAATASPTAVTTTGASIYTSCCRYNLEYGMNPGVSWGKTPEDEKAWYSANDCDTVLGGKGAPACKPTPSPATITGCCRYNLEYGMNPQVSWGRTPEEEKAWYKENDCDNAMGGKGAPACKAVSTVPPTAAGTVP